MEILKKPRTWIGFVDKRAKRKKMYIRFGTWKVRSMYRAGSFRGVVDSIKMDLREIRWDGVDWIDLAQDTDRGRTLVNMVMNLLISKNAGKFLSSCTIGGFSRRVQLHD
jgi:hypothetical protein